MTPSPPFVTPQGLTPGQSPCWGDTVTQPRIPVGTRHPAAWSRTDRTSAGGMGLAAIPAWHLLFPTAPGSPSSHHKPGGVPPPRAASRMCQLRDELDECGAPGLAAPLCIPQGWGWSRQGAALDVATGELRLPAGKAPRARKGLRGIQRPASFMLSKWPQMKSRCWRRRLPSQAASETKAGKHSCSSAAAASGANNNSPIRWQGRSCPSWSRFGSVQCLRPGSSASQCSSPAELVGPHGTVSSLLSYTHPHPFPEISSLLPCTHPDPLPGAVVASGKGDNRQLGGGSFPVALGARESRRAAVGC